MWRGTRASEFWALEPSPIWMMSPTPFCVRAKLEVADGPVVRARRGPQRGVGIGGPQPREQRASVGLMRTPAGGRAESGVDVRSVIHASPVFTGSTKLPTNSAFAASTTVSPGRAVVQRALKIASRCYDRLSPPRLTGRCTAPPQRR